jgi:hypothetical protein
MSEVFQIFCELPETVALHVVAEGAGAILLHELLDVLPPEHAKRIRNVFLAMPACTVTEFDVIRQSLKQAGAQLDVIVPDELSEKRMRVGVYGGSLLDLVQMSFVEEPPLRTRDDTDPNKMKSQAPDHSRILGRNHAITLLRERKNGVKGWFLKQIKGPPGDEPITRMRSITMARETQEHIRNRILGRVAGQPARRSRSNGKAKAEGRQARRKAAGEDQHRRTDAKGG